MSDTRSERNCTHMEFLHCYVEDPTSTFERRSTRDFKRLNESSRQRTVDNRLMFIHRTAYPSVLCDARPSSPEDTASLFEESFQRRSFTPRPGVTLHQIGKTTKQVDHDVKVPIATIPVSESELLQRTTLTEEDRAICRELKSVPYDAAAKETLGPNNSIYRADYGHGAKEWEDFGAYKLPRVLPTGKIDADLLNVVHTQTKREFLAAAAHMSELKSVQAAKVRMDGSPRRAVLPGLPVDFSLAQRSFSRTPRRPATARESNSPAAAAPPPAWRRDSGASTPRSSPRTPRTPAIPVENTSASGRTPSPRKFAKVTRSFFSSHGGYAPYPPPGPAPAGCDEGRHY